MKSGLDAMPLFLLVDLLIWMVPQLNISQHSKTPFIYFQVFVVLEGEITVVIHTTQFTAKKGNLPNIS